MNWIHAKERTRKHVGMEVRIENHLEEGLSSQR